MKPTAQAWQQIAIALKPFNDGSRSRHEDRPTVVAWAIQLRESPRRTTEPDFGTAPGHQNPPDGHNSRRAVNASLDQLPVLARRLHDLIQQWPTHGRVLAYAAQLPRRDELLNQALAGSTPAGLVRVDSIDLRPALNAVRHAAIQCRHHPDPDPGVEADSRRFAGSAAPLSLSASSSGLVDSRSLVHRLSVPAPAGSCFSYPRCSVISSCRAVSMTVLVSCLRSPSGPVRDKPCSLATRTSSTAACCSADCSARSFFATISGSVPVISAPFRQPHRPACQAENTVPCTVPLGTRPVRALFLQVGPAFSCPNGCQDIDRSFTRRAS